MKIAVTVAFVGAFFLFGIAAPETASAKKGGVGNGGGYSEDGVLYHSHSSRSYSGKDYQKGRALGHYKDKGSHGNGKAKGHNKEKTRKIPLQ
jgi:hypothetical protein